MSSSTTQVVQQAASDEQLCDAFYNSFCDDDCYLTLEQEQLMDSIGDEMPLHILKNLACESNSHDKFLMDVDAKHYVIYCYNEFLKSIGLCLADIKTGRIGFIDGVNEPVCIYTPTMIARYNTLFESFSKQLEMVKSVVVVLKKLDCHCYVVNLLCLCYKCYLFTTSDILVCTHTDNKDYTNTQQLAIHIGVRHIQRWIEKHSSNQTHLLIIYVLQELSTKTELTRPDGYAGKCVDHSDNSVYCVGCSYPQITIKLNLQLKSTSFTYVQTLCIARAFLNLYVDKNPICSHCTIRFIPNEK